MVIDDSFYMQLALNEAWKYQGLTYPNPAVGALLLDKNNKIISIEAHKKAGFPHAEVEALKSGFLRLSDDKLLKEELQNLTDSSKIHEFLIKNSNNLFKECAMYVTLEPCAHYGKTPPCAGLISSLGLKKVIIGALDINKEASGGAEILKSANIEIKTNILEKECELLLEPFKLWSGKNFIFFKHAQTLNGTIDGGYISSEEMLKFVHALRDKIDLIVVGGNTVRVDRPTLDARKVNGKAPDVLIYSKNSDFDNTIPLFSVAKRRVFIKDNLSLLESYKFIMIEGGSEMFDAVKDKIHWHLALVSPNLKNGKKFDSKIKEEIIHAENVDSEIKIWAKPIF
ncbi:MAG: diaminohydroxyphosphoribosylaminopyrimidine deaminase [Campylobacterota bacterium]|nr:diaminohydroxyphosphoribosylaminopyrimidine deaminase [Campylobacterota bacterium]